MEPYGSDHARHLAPAPPGAGLPLALARPIRTTKVVRLCTGDKVATVSSLPMAARDRTLPSLPNNHRSKSTLALATTITTSPRVTKKRMATSTSGRCLRRLSLAAFPMHQFLCLGLDASGRTHAPRLLLPAEHVVFPRVVHRARATTSSSRLLRPKHRWNKLRLRNDIARRSKWICLMSHMARPQLHEAQLRSSSHCCHYSSTGRSQWHRYSSNSNSNSR